MSYADDLLKLKRDDPDAAIRVARKAVKAGELNFGNAEALLMLQMSPEDRNKVNLAVTKLLKEKK